MFYFSNFKISFSDVSVLEVGKQAFKRHFRVALALARLFSVELFGSGEQRPAPASVGKPHITAFVAHDFFIREATNATI